jgi:hypothetical protein
MSRMDKYIVSYGYIGSKYVTDDNHTVEEPDSDLSRASGPRWPTRLHYYVTENGCTHEHSIALFSILKILASPRHDKQLLTKIPATRQTYKVTKSTTRRNSPERFLVLRDLVLHTLYGIIKISYVRLFMHLFICAIVRVMIVRHGLCCRMLLESRMHVNLDPTR